MCDEVGANSDGDGDDGDGDGGGDNDGLSDEEHNQSREHVLRRLFASFDVARTSPPMCAIITYTTIPR